MKFIVRVKGGPGSGHHGHAGRPGDVGGSIPGVGGMSLGGQVTATPSSSMRERAIRNANEVIEDVARSTGMTMDEVKQKIIKRLDDDLAQPISVRRSSRGALNIAEEGRFKTQFETGTSSGYFDPVHRGVAEKNGLGVSREVLHTTRPVYGYFGAGSPDVMDYGAVEFVLKDSIKVRATYTIGDSLEGFSGQYQTGGKRPADVAAWDDRIHGYMLDGVSASHYRGPSYIEAQVHGGLSLKDVAKVVIHTSEGYDPGRYTPVCDALELRGIKVEYVQTE